MPLRSETNAILAPVGTMNGGRGGGTLLAPPASAGGADPVPGAPPPPPQAEARRRASARATGQDVARMPQTGGRIGRRPGQAPRAVGRGSSPRGGQKGT